MLRRALQAVGKSWREGGSELGPTELGAESCPRPLVLKAGVRPRGPELLREKGHTLCPNSGSRWYKQRSRLQMGRVCALRLSSAWADPATASLFPPSRGARFWDPETFQKARSGGLPMLSSTLGSPSELIKPSQLLGLALGE